MHVIYVFLTSNPWREYVNIFLNFYLMCMDALPVCVNTQCAHLVIGEARRSLSLLELEL